MRLSVLDWIVVALLIIGGINWGLVGLFGFNLVTAVFATIPILARIVFIVVGIAAVYYLIELIVKPDRVA